jgi:FkbM family methyltransferase
MKPSKRSAFVTSASAMVDIALSGQVPSRRALATLAKLQGRRLERRWPFLPKAQPGSLNLGFEDVLEFQYARSRKFFVVVIGAYDGVENDPVSNFVRTHRCNGIFVEPQPGVFERLRQNLGRFDQLNLLNAAIDRATGEREFFRIPPGIPGLPQWTEQLASFKRAHLEKHEDRAPGVSSHIEATTVATISFDDLLRTYAVKHIDVLQIDAEGMDALLLSWFPFERIRPVVVHYEIAHMTGEELRQTRETLASLGYSLYPTESPTDEMAICI